MKVNFWSELTVLCQSKINKTHGVGLNNDVFYLILLSRGLSQINRGNKSAVFQLCRGIAEQRYDCITTWASSMEQFGCMFQIVNFFCDIHNKDYILLHDSRLLFLLSVHFSEACHVGFYLLNSALNHFPSPILAFAG